MNLYSHTWSLLCGLNNLINMKFLPGQSLYLLCLSGIGNPELTLLVCDLNIGWYSWDIVLVSMILWSCLHLCWWMVLISLLIPLLQHTLSSFLQLFLFHLMISKFRSYFRVIADRSLDQQCLCLVVHAASYHIIVIMILIISVVI